MKWLETMGAASLPVFCAHLVLVLLALALLGETNPDRPMWIDPVMFVGCIVILYIVARLVLAFEARGTRKKAGEEPADSNAVRGAGGEGAAALRTNAPPAASTPSSTNPDVPR
jgi:peptidoglycan/LPS O-acetylase OafA/YrhL